MATKDLTGRFARWTLKLQEYDFEIECRAGACHGNDGALSRLPRALPALIEEEEEHGVCNVYANVLSILPNQERRSVGLVSSSPAV